MRKILLILVFVATHFILFAQSTIKGKVTSASSKETLIGVSVIVDNNSTGAITDVNGMYTLSVAAGKHEILFRMIGMKDKKIGVTVTEGETQNLNISLAESTKELGLVVVSAGKFEQKIENVTVSMNVIKPSMVEAKNTTSMEDILDQSPAVNMIDGQANIRGGSGWSYGAGSRVMVLVDDLPMLTADAGDAKWSFLPVENLEQIEVIKGASSALFGSSAMNGVINIRTAFPKDTAQTRINYFYGVYDRNQKITLDDTTYNLSTDPTRHMPISISGFNFFHSEKVGLFDVVLGGNYMRDEGYRQGEYENRMRFNGNLRYRFKNITGLSCGVNFNVQQSIGALLFIWQNDTTGAYKSSSTISDYITPRTNIDPYITYADKNGNVIKLRTRYFRSNNINNTHQGSVADLYYGDLQYQKHFGEKYVASAGVTNSSSVVKSELYENHNGNNLAFYAQGDATIGRLTLSAGGRLEKYKIDSLSDNYTPVVRAGLNYHIIGETYLRTSFGQGYRYPTIAEKYIRTAIGAAKIYPNDSLKSESGYSSEIGIMQGLKIGGWKGYFDVAAFYTEYHDMIEFTFSQWEPATVNPLTYEVNYGIGFKALNIGDTRIKGLDLSLSGEGTIGPLGVTVLFGYTYMDPTVLHYDSSYIKAQHKLEPDSIYIAYLGSDTTNFLKYRFNNLAKADVGITYKRYTVGMSMRYNSFMKNIDELFVDRNFGSLFTPGVTHYRRTHRTGDIVYDARVSYQICPTTKFSFIIKNLFNYIYMQRPADMQPPRTFTGQLTIAF